jgi:hypothetical protein
MAMSGHIPRRTLIRLPCFELQRGLSHCNTAFLRSGIRLPSKSLHAVPQ